MGNSSPWVEIGSGAHSNTSFHKSVSIMVIGANFASCLFYKGVYASSLQQAIAAPLIFGMESHIYPFSGSSVFLLSFFECL